MKTYSCKDVSNLIDKYIAKGGNVTELSEGSLGYGNLILHGEGLKTIVVNEIHLNEWSSGHSIRFYNRMPKKYEAVI